MPTYLSCCHEGTRSRYLVCSWLLLDGERIRPLYATLGRRELDAVSSECRFPPTCSSALPLQDRRPRLRTTRGV